MLNWYSPNIESKSAIAQFTSALKPELEEKFHVRFLSNTFVNYNLGINIYNLGNNFDEHNNIWYCSINNPGIIILHDIHLKDFFRKAFILNSNQSFYKYFISECWKFHSNTDQLIRKFHEIEDEFPFYEFALFKSKHVIVHSTYAKNILLKNGFQNVSCLNLPFTGALNNIIRSKLISKKRPVRLVIFGYIGENRFVKELYDLIYNLDISYNFEIHLVGTLSKEIDNFIKDRNIIYHGYVNDLNSILQKMDIAINIRLPSVGESSLSLLFCWANKLPCIVMKTKAYKEIPENSVFFLDNNFTKKDFRKLLVFILENPNEVSIRIEKGLLNLQQKHLPRHYVNAFFSIISKNIIFSSNYKKYINELMIRDLQKVHKYTIEI